MFIARSTGLGELDPYQDNFNALINCRGRHCASNTKVNGSIPRECTMCVCACKPLWNKQSFHKSCLDSIFIVIEK